MELKPLDRGVILRKLKTHWFGRSLVVLDQCSSTNDVIARLAEDKAPHGTVVLAETQNAGRGRFGRTWYSPKGGVWMSILIEPHEGPSSMGSLPIIAALGVAKTLVRWKVPAAVRWPNDVVVDDRKIAGVLVESKSKGNELTYAAVGIGINANVDTGAIDSIRYSSTSLLAVLGEPVDREDLIVSLLSDLEETYESIQAAGESACLGTLADLDWSSRKQLTVRTANRDLVGLFDSYESLSRVRIRTSSGLERVDTNAVVSVHYKSDQSPPATG